MNFADLAIIYLAFGAPLAVYKYLQCRELYRTRRVLVAGLTFLFWIPTATQLVYRQFSNAYFSRRFVSRRRSDSATGLSGTCEDLGQELVRAQSGMTVHQIRETIERYVGLSNVSRDMASSSEPAGSELFKAAGREQSGPAAACLARRNANRVERHLRSAREDFVGLFLSMSSAEQSVRGGVIKLGEAVVSELGDHEALDRLRSLEQYGSELWKLGQSKSPLDAAPISPLLITTPSVNGE